MNEENKDIKIIDAHNEEGNRYVTEAEALRNISPEHIDNVLNQLKEIISKKHFFFMALGTDTYIRKEDFNTIKGGLSMFGCHKFNPNEVISLISGQLGRAFQSASKISDILEDKK